MVTVLSIVKTVFFETARRGEKDLSIFSLFLDSYSLHKLVL